MWIHSRHSSLYSCLIWYFRVWRFKRRHSKLVTPLGNNTNPVLSDSGAPLKFAFCMLKNTTQADFQLKISTPGILAAIRSSGKKVTKLQLRCEWISKTFLHGWWTWKNSFFISTTFLAPAISWSIRSEKRPINRRSKKSC